VIPCDADGLPKPEVTWLKDGSEVATTGSSRYSVRRDGSLRLTAVTVDDSGLYECIASNEAGTARREVILTVQGIIHIHPRPLARQYPELIVNYYI